VIAHECGVCLMWWRISIPPNVNVTSVLKEDY
jgi:hypothetical protein